LFHYDQCTGTFKRYRLQKLVKLKFDILSHLRIRLIYLSRISIFLKLKSFLYVNCTTICCMRCCLVRVRCTRFPQPWNCVGLKKSRKLHLSSALNWTTFYIDFLFLLSGISTEFYIFHYRWLKLEPKCPNFVLNFIATYVMSILCRIYYNILIYNTIAHLLPHSSPLFTLIVYLKVFWLKRNLNRMKKW